MLSNYKELIERYNNTKYKYSSVLLEVNKDIKKYIISKHDYIHESHLAHSGFEKLPHVTVLFGLHLKKWNVHDIIELFKINNIHKLILKTDGVKYFSINKNNEQYDVLYISIKPTKELLELRKLFTDNYKYSLTHKEYKPHLTLAYVKSGMGAKYIKLLNSKIKNFIFVADTIQLSDMYGEKINIILK